MQFHPFTAGPSREATTAPRAMRDARSRARRGMCHCVIWTRTHSADPAAHTLPAIDQQPRGATANSSVAAAVSLRVLTRGGRPVQILSAPVPRHTTAYRRAAGAAIALSSTAAGVGCGALSLVAAEVDAHPHSG